MRLFLIGVQLKIRRYFWIGAAAIKEVVQVEDRAIPVKLSHLLAMVGNHVITPECPIPTTICWYLCHIHGPVLIAYHPKRQYNQASALQDDVLITM